MKEEIRKNVDTMIALGYSSNRITEIIKERNQNIEESIEYLESQKENIILLQIKKLFESGFSKEEVKIQLQKQGIDYDKYAGLANKINEKTRPKSTYILLGIFLIIAGLLLLVLCKNVFGSLRFSLNSTGDLRRWKELFFQPFNSLLAIGLGITLLVRKKYVTGRIAKIILLFFGSVTAFTCLFFSEVTELFVSSGVLVLFFLSTKKEK